MQIRFYLILSFVCLLSEPSEARLKLFGNRNSRRAPVRQLQPVRVVKPVVNSTHTDNVPAPEKEVNKPRPIANDPQVPEAPKIKPTFGRSILQSFQTRPKLFQRQLKDTPIDPYVAIFCENPHRLVCETSLDNLPGSTWPEQILPRNPRGAFETGKKLLNFLTDHHFDYNESNKKAIHDQLASTQILITNISGPTAFSTPPRIEIPPTYWNLFSVFHELGHIIDYKSTYPLNKGEVAQVLRNANQISSIDQIETLIKDKQAEMIADKVAAKGFAFLGDPHIRKVGYEPIDSGSLLKTLKAAMGFLCTSQGSSEHPSGKFRINFIGADEDLRAVLGCPVTK